MITIYSQHFDRVGNLENCTDTCANEAEFRSFMQDYIMIEGIPLDTLKVDFGDGKLRHAKLSFE